MFNRKFISLLKGTINTLEDDKKKLKTKCDYLENNCVILIDTNKEQREKIKDLENNIEFLVNNLSAQKRARLGLDTNTKKELAD